MRDLLVWKELDSECCVVVHLDDMYIHMNHHDVSMSWVKECAALDGDERFGCRKESDSECYIVVHLDDMYIQMNHDDDVSMS